MLIAAFQLHCLTTACSSGLIAKLLQVLVIVFLVKDSAWIAHPLLTDLARPTPPRATTNLLWPICVVCIQPYIHCFPQLTAHAPQVVKYRALPSRGAATEPTSPASSEDVDVSESSADALTSSGSDAFEAVRSSSRPFETSDTIKMLSAGLLNMTQEQTPAVASVMSTMTTAMVS